MPACRRSASQTATAYLDKHHVERPWLSVARDCPPEVQRVFAALDQGGGHAHIRHEGWVTEEMNERRVRNLEDPAQLDPAKRVAGVDGVKVGNQSSSVRRVSLRRITDPEAFATAFARGIEHPDVRAALDSPGPVPSQSACRYPTSWAMTVTNSAPAGGWNRSTGACSRHWPTGAAWVAGNRDAPEPRTRPVETFEGGTVTFVFRAEHRRPPRNQHNVRGPAR